MDKLELETSLDASWKDQIGEELNKPYMIELKKFLAEEAEKYVIYPPSGLFFNAFNMTRFDQVKVVIVGQDPYHGEGQAHGLSFSVPKGVNPPPSLKNIFKELQEDLNIKPASHGCLTSWAKQGVLLLNATLSVRAASPASHQGRGWELFTDAVIKKLADSTRPLVFILWGKYAKDKFQHIDPKNRPNHLVITSPHPSPFSAYTGFFGSRPFSKTNAFLTAQGLNPIDWNLR